MRNAIKAISGGLNLPSNDCPETRENNFDSQRKKVLASVKLTDIILMESWRTDISCN